MFFKDLEFKANNKLQLISIYQKNQPMEEIVSLIFHGCKLAKDLETHLPNIANQPQLLIRSCDEIIRVFGDTRERLSALQAEAAYAHHEQPPQVEVGGGVPDWLRMSQAMEILSAQVAHHHQQQQHHGLEAVAGQDLGGGSMEAMAMDVADPSRGSTPFQRPRRRKDEADRRTIRVPAPRMGNTEIPPEDGYTWRKYGQKEILGSRFPRAYYRCTHQKLYNCPAKKQVQRLDNDPYTFEVTYRGDHTCTMSSTAPSNPPPPEAITTSQSPSHWLSMDIKSSGEGASSGSYTISHGMQMYREQLGLGGAGPSSFGGGGGGSGGGSAAGAGPSSTTRYNVEYAGGVADLADVMFNSGSSSNNSMELIFSTMEEKWEGGDKKN